MLNPPLLILDIDETLIHAAEDPLHAPADFMVEGLYVYIRPGLDKFLRTTNESYTLACWSSATRDYLEAILHVILPPQKYGLQFVWDRSHCLRKVDLATPSMCAPFSAIRLTTSSPVSPPILQKSQLYQTLDS